MTGGDSSLKSCLACKQLKPREEFEPRSSVCDACAVVYVEIGNPENTRKICFTCNEHKPLSEFSLNSEGRLGRTNHCKQCMSRSYMQSRDVPNDRSCETCGKPIDLSVKIGTKYCSKKCRNKAIDGVAARARLKAYHAERLVNNQSRQCTKCGTEKPLTEFYAAKAECKECYIERQRKRELENPEAKSKSRKEWRKRNPDKVRKQRIKNAVRTGKIKYIQHVTEWRKWIRSTRHDAHVKAMKAWKKTPESREWCAKHFAAIGIPWRNPHLSAAEKYAMQYSMDTAFRLGEINRQTWRKQTLEARDDGTISFRELLSERKTCPYCGTKITKDNAVADHLDPIKLGGANSHHNLTICCRDCNKKKSGRHYLDWVAMLPEDRQGPALKWYKRKHGHDPRQDSLAFEFAA